MRSASSRRANDQTGSSIVAYSFERRDALLRLEILPLHRGSDAEIRKWRFDRHFRFWKGAVDHREILLAMTALGRFELVLKTPRYGGTLLVKVLENDAT